MKWWYESCLLMSLDTDNAVEWELSGNSAYEYCYDVADSNGDTSCDWPIVSDSCDPTATVWARVWEGPNIIASESWTAEEVNPEFSC